jgi:hypothetical protein
MKTLMNTLAVILMMVAQAIADIHTLVDAGRTPLPKADFIITFEGQTAVMFDVKDREPIARTQVDPLKNRDEARGAALEFALAVAAHFKQDMKMFVIIDDRYSVKGGLHYKADILTLDARDIQSVSHTPPKSVSPSITK